jgi:hypothetical protein
MYVCMYVYSRGGPQMALAPQPSMIYCAFVILHTIVLIAHPLYWRLICHHTPTVEDNTIYHNH